MNVGLTVTRSARRYPGRVAVFDDRRAVDYSTLDRRTNQLANVLGERLGIVRGDRVALLVHNRSEVLEVLGGCAKAGAVYVGLNFRLTAKEYEAIFDNAEPRLIITETEFRELADSLAGRAGIPVLDVDDSGPGGFETLLSEASSRSPATLHEVRPEDDFCIVYTSGTTGRPKGVLFDHGAVMQHAIAAIIEYDWRHESRWLMMLPHNSSVQITLLPSLTIGGCVGFTESRGFDGQRFAAQVEEHGITHSYLVPTMLFRLLEQVIDPQPLATLETLGYGAAPTPPDRVRALVERFGPIFNQLYGMAEICSIGTMLRKSDHARAVRDKPALLSSCGQSSYGVDVRVVDDDRRDVEFGERGEVIFGGPYVMKEYYRDPERTAEALVDGWMHSGDIGEMDEEGFIYIVDRKKDLIIRGGRNIVPSEIEDVLFSHDAVLEAAVVGIPDVEWGESLLAVLALKEGRTVEPEALATWCKERGLPTLLIPSRFEFVDALPQNLVGKVDKRALRDNSWGFAPNSDNL
jgi:fatty-acyl-CoA synthase